MSSSILRPAVSCQSRLQYLTVLFTHTRWFQRRKSSSVSRAPASLVTSVKPQSYATLVNDQLRPELCGPLSQDCDEESIYRYTSGRWVWNEKEQLSCRYIKFNITELARIAAQVTRSKSCIQVQKLPEGNFSKVFLITMDDGKEVIAKLPNPNAGRPHFTTASEVATMDYVRVICYASYFI